MPKKKTNPKPVEPIKFRHQYHKLALDEFTTIRGAAQMRRLRVGQVIPVETPGGNFDAEIIHLQIKRVDEMSLEFLKTDAEYPGFVISCVQDFIDLLNSFRAPAWSRVQFDSPLTVITLRKVS